MSAAPDSASASPPSPQQQEDYVPRGVLLTGGAGFIGSHVVCHLAALGMYVVVVDKLDYCANEANFDEVRHLPHVHFAKQDVTELAGLLQVFKEHPELDTVMHFAAQSHVDNSFGNSFTFTHNNVMGTHVILEAAKQQKGRVRRFIHVSTDEVYGDGESGAASTESTAFAPTNPYAATKCAAECLVQAYARSFGLPTIVTRSNNIYGPKQYPEKLIPKFISLLLERRNHNNQRENNQNGGVSGGGGSDGGGGIEEAPGPGPGPGPGPAAIAVSPAPPYRRLPIHGDGRNCRNFLFTADVVAAFEVVLRRGRVGGVYNIGTDVVKSNNEVATDLVRAFGFPLRQPVQQQQPQQQQQQQQQQVDGAEGVGAAAGQAAGGEATTTTAGEQPDLSEYVEYVSDRPFNDLRYPLDTTKLEEVRACVRARIRHSHY